MPLKVGIVGMNSIAHSHAPHYVSDDLAELVAVCDVVKERADAGVEKYGGKAYYSLDDMLADEDLDLVDVSTGGYENGSWHFEPAMQAMEAGKHVIVEKPLSSDVNQGRQMVAKAQEQGVYLACNLNHYFTPVSERGRRYIDEGQMGELVYCLMKMGFHGGHIDDYKGPGSPKVKGWPYFHLKAFLSHPFSVMRYFCGDATHVQAFLGAPGFRRAGGDLTLSTASIHLRFANNSVGYLLSQRGDASYGLGGWWSCEVAGTRGTFVVENCIEKCLYWQAPRAGGVGKPEAEPTEVTETGTMDFGQTFKHRLHALLEDISNGVPLEQLRGSGRDALAVLEYTFAVIESHENGGEMVRPHPLPPLTGDPRVIRG
ncbi:MAG: Gfo/Idh/MocA family oxidoreductase [Armatimonadetes bacterium]|nr:Gfo/Idh/MocA family oxidoreductase [Armatimonadota bacterium]